MAKASPDISVIVPSYDRAWMLEGCLCALAAQTLDPARFEVIVCDDGSRVPVTAALAAALDSLSDRIRLRVIRQDNAGPAPARNRGAAAAGGRFLAFTDDDCRPEPDWLERLLARFAARPAALLGGGLRTHAGADAYARATQAIMDFVYADQERRGGMRLFSTGNLAIGAWEFERVGGFSTAFRQAAGEDYDLCARWYASGGAVEYVPEAVVVHDHALTLRAYLRQHFAYGRGLLRMRKRMRERGVRMSRRRAGDLIESGFYLRLIASPLRAQGLAGLPCSALVALSQAATAAGTVRELILPDAQPRADHEPVRPVSSP